VQRTAGSASRSIHGHRRGPTRPAVVWRFLGHLEPVLAQLGCSYRDRSAGHLDLVQWATKPVWSQLDDRVREAAAGRGRLVPGRPVALGPARSKRPRRVAPPRRARVQAPRHPPAARRWPGRLDRRLVDGRRRAERRCGRPGGPTRARASTAGWIRWAPVNSTAVAAHVAGGVGLTVTEWSRVRSHKGVGTSTAIKAGLTGAGLGVAAWSAVLNRKMAAAGSLPVQGATEPAASTPRTSRGRSVSCRSCSWLNPLIGLALLGATAVHEEQQRAAQQAKGRLQGSLGSLASPAGLASQQRWHSSCSRPASAARSPTTRALRLSRSPRSGSWTYCRSERGPASASERGGPAV
jgi:hypothetical protein